MDDLGIQILTYLPRYPSFNEGATGPFVNGTQRICRTAPLLPVKSLCARGAHLLARKRWQRVGQLKFFKAMLPRHFP